MESKQTHRPRQTVICVFLCVSMSVNEWVCGSVPTLLNMVGERRDVSVWWSQSQLFQLY